MPGVATNGPTWIVLTRDISHAVHIATQPVVVASMIMDADTGLVRGMAVAESGPQARAQAIAQALTRPAGTLPPETPIRVLCGPGDAQALTGELATLLTAPVKASEVVSVEAEDIFDSFVAHMGGRQQPDTFATPDDWALLMAAADGYRRAQPWQRWADDQHLDLIVRVASVPARYLAIVLGQEGIQHGLVLYPGAAFPDQSMVTDPDQLRTSLPAGTIMFYLDPPSQTPPEFTAKATRYGWPADADLLPAWVTRGPDGPADLDQTAVRRLTLALTAVLTHDAQPDRTATTTGETKLPAQVAGGFTIKPAA
jgi:hypothetical protein